MFLPIIGKKGKIKRRQRIDSKPTGKKGFFLTKFPLP